MFSQIIACISLKKGTCTCSCLMILISRRKFLNLQKLLKSQFLIMSLLVATWRKAKNSISLTTQRLLKGVLLLFPKHILMRLSAIVTNKLLVLFRFVKIKRNAVAYWHPYFPIMFSKSSTSIS